MVECGSARAKRKVPTAGFRPLLTSIGETGPVLMQSSHTHPLRRSLAPAVPRAGWRSVGALALLCSGVAWASLPRFDHSSAERREWQALGIAPLAGGAAMGARMAPTDAVEPLEFVAKRPVASMTATPPRPVAPPEAPLRIRGRVGDGLYWSLRASGASPQVAAGYLTALATATDVGEVAIGDSFDMVLSKDQNVLYAGLDRAAGSDLQLVRWDQNGRSQWIDAAQADRPTPVASGMAWPVSGRITSYFGYRRHPILRFSRLHAGLDFGAG
jgi:hypothetical protein